ncbi:protein of unknown function [Kingella kingae]|nr:protein of unknown function [Kingella kingae]
MQAAFRNPTKAAYTFSIHNKKFGYISNSTPSPAREGWGGQNPQQPQSTMLCNDFPSPTGEGTK